jgi:hypothetical protein
MTTHSLANLQYFYQYVIILQPLLPQIPACSVKIPTIGHAVDLAAAALKAASTMSPLLNYNHPHLFGFRSRIMTVSSTKNIAPRFENILPSGTSIVRVSADETRERDVLACLRLFLACLHHPGFTVSYFDAIMLSD